MISHAAEAVGPFNSPPSPFFPPFSISQAATITRIVIIRYPRFFDIPHVNYPKFVKVKVLCCQIFNNSVRSPSIILVFSRIIDDLRAKR